jgi:hypothetical protein
MSGSIGGGWSNGFHGEAEHAPARKHAGLSLPDLQVLARPAAYLTTRMFWKKLPNVPKVSSGAM